jgi:O-antigen/teichoic acid export membrane protein
MAGLLRRLVAGAAAYQASSLLASAIALVTLPLYTRYLTTADLGYAETILTFVILISIVVRFGMGDAFVRFWFDDDDRDRRVALARSASGWTFTVSTALALVLLAAAGPLSRLLLATDDPALMRLGILGLWAFANLEIAYAMLRVEERRRLYVAVSCTNVLLTVTATVTLVVGLDAGADGYVLGNYGASTAVLLALWVLNRRLVAFVPPGRQVLEPLLRFGGPTVPADAAVFALNVVDRAYLLRAESPGAAGVYAVAVKLSTVVIVAVRGFQAAWPPLVYSVTDDAQAARLYARVTTAYVALTGWVVAACALLGPFALALLAAPDFAGADAALPWVALGWAMYGLYLVFVTIAGRVKVTARNFPAALLGLAVNVVVLVALVPPLGIAGAGIALAAAYLVMLAALHLLTRRLFAVPFERARLAGLVVLLAAGAAAGDVLLPAAGSGALAARTAVLVALAPLALLLAARPREVLALARGVSARR